MRFSPHANQGGPDANSVEKKSDKGYPATLVPLKRLLDVYLFKSAENKLCNYWLIDSMSPAPEFGDLRRQVCITSASQTLF